MVSYSWFIKIEGLLEIKCMLRNNTDHLLLNCNMYLEKSLEYA